MDDYDKIEQLALNAKNKWHKQNLY
jgi:hypothetical protein